MHVILVYDSNNPRKHSKSSRIIQSYHQDAIEAIADALQANGHRVSTLEADQSLEESLQELKPDFVFNCASRVSQSANYSYAPHILKQLHIPFTGSGEYACRNAYRKDLTKIILSKASIPAPRAAVVRNPEDFQLPKQLHFPLFVKPIGGGCSYGIGKQNLIKDPNKLKKKLAKIYENTETPLLIEEFLGGREFTVGVLGNQHPRVLPIMEFGFPEEAQESFRSYSLKMVEYEDEKMTCPADLQPFRRFKVQDMAIRAYRALQCRDYARVDLRMDRRGSPFILEVNALPNLMPETSSYTLMAKKAGLSFRELVRAILRTAVKRYA